MDNIYSLFVASSALKKQVQTAGFKENQTSSSSSPVLDEGVHQLLSQAGQAVRMVSWITILAAFLWNIPSSLCV